MDIETLNGKKVDCADVSRISLRDVYMRICECRDFEISHVWQRAIFMTAFLLGCFTAYGVVASYLFDDEHQFLYSWFANAAAFFVTLVGIVVSLFWIMMAKGSKAWYELYENAICAFVTLHSANGCDANVDLMAQHNWRKLVVEAHRIDSKIKDGPRSFSILSCLGGAYSVSKINIGIGILSFCVWIIISLVHILIAAKEMPFSAQEWISLFLKFCEHVADCPVVMLSLLLVVGVGFPVVFKRMFKSGYLTKPEGEL